MKTAILGGGVSGLALARFLQQGGLGDVHIFEASRVAGGLCSSKRVDGYTYDIAGGHILFSKDRAALEWMKQESGGEQAHEKRERHTKIRFGDRWVHYPFENGLGDLPASANFDCLKGYVEAWHARRVSGSSAPADFAGWIRWRFGAGIARHFMDPYNEKIWKRPLAELTSAWVAGRVPDAPLDDVLRASVGIRTEGYTHQSLFYYPKSGGFQALTDGLALRVGASLRLATRVERVQMRGGGAGQVNGEDFDCVVSTLPLNEVPQVVQGLSAEAAQAMRELSYNSLATFLLALKVPVPSDLSWIYLPHHEQGPANRVTYMSNYATLNAPAGKGSLLCEVTLRGGERPAAGLGEEVVAGLERAGLLRREELLFIDPSWVRYAYIVYDHPHAARRKLALDSLEALGITPLGRFGRYDYDNSDQCVIKARELSTRLLEQAGRGGRL